MISGHPSLFSGGMSPGHMTFLWGLPSSDRTSPYFSLLLGWYGEPYGGKMDWEPVQKGQWKERKICSLRNKAVLGKHTLSLDPGIQSSPR